MVLAVLYGMHFFQLCTSFSRKAPKGFACGCPAWLSLLDGWLQRWVRDTVMREPHRVSGRPAHCGLCKRVQVIISKPVSGTRLCASASSDEARSHPLARYALTLTDLIRHQLNQASPPVNQKRGSCSLMLRDYREGFCD